MQIMARQNVVHKRVEALEEVMPGNPASRDLRKLMLSMGILDECQALMQDMGALDHSYTVRCCRNAWLCLCLVYNWCRFGSQNMSSGVCRLMLKACVQCTMLVCDDVGWKLMGMSQCAADWLPCLLTAGT